MGQLITGYRGTLVRVRNAHGRVGLYRNSRPFADFSIAVKSPESPAEQALAKNAWALDRISGHKRHAEPG